MKTLNVGIVGYKFMGKAHSNAWKNTPHFFDLSVRPTMKVACDTNGGAAREMAEKWGWQESETDWRKVVARDDVDVIDIATPPGVHCETGVEKEPPGWVHGVSGIKVQRAAGAQSGNTVYTARYPS